MKTMYAALLILLLSLAHAAFAGPKITLDSLKYFYGSVSEDTMPEIKSIIPVRNTGDAPLKISEIRKSCGCTRLEYDSVIAPGKAGNIKINIKIVGMSGHISKSITINSNDPKDPMLQVRLEAFIVQPLTISPNFIRVPAGKGTAATPVELTIETDKRDFRISDVSFQPINASEQDNFFDKKLKIPIEYTVTLKDTAKKNGMYEYSMKLSTKDTVSDTRQGSFLLKTNHPKKNEISIYGMLEKTVSR